MARDPRHDVLFEPVQLGPKVMRNRFYQTPHCTSLGTEAPAAQAHLRGVKAEGGWAAVNTEFCSVHPSSDARPWVSARLWDDDDARNLALMVDMVHEHDSLAGVELWHGGSVVGNMESRLPARSAGQFTDDTSFATTCYELDQAGIREVQGYYVAAAERARDVGFDIVNVHGAEGGAITQHFFMRKFNQRTDEYGGSLENRARFWLETIEMVREAVGDDCAITARLCIDTLNDSPLGIRADQEAVAFIELADHLVDFWDLQPGGWRAADWAGDSAVPSRFAGEFTHRDLYVAVSGATSKPIAGVGRFTNPDTMAEAVRSGPLDIIAAARPSIADPFLPKKIEEGRLSEIRECIGCNICAARFNQSGPIICTQNPTMGEEYRRGWHPERFTKAGTSERDVLVVGAGPAGLECAMVLGKRGMRRVHLVDDAAEMGGSMKRISAYPGLAEWARVVQYRKIQLQGLRNVDVIPSTKLSAEDVLTYGAEIVIVATGARWRRDGRYGPAQEPLPGADVRAVYTPEDVSDAGGDLPGERIVVYDAEGYFTGVGVAQALKGRGKDVTIITPFPHVGPYLFYTGEGGGVNERLRAEGISVIESHSLTGVGSGTVIGKHTYETDPTEWPADNVVLVTERRSCTGLYDNLSGSRERLAAEGIEAVHRIGDCVAPRLIADCIFDGHRLGREIDSDDPDVPLPYRREFRVLPQAETVT